MPFAAGVVAESDLDYPVAKALASELLSVPAFSVPSESDAQTAANRMRAIGRAICTVPAFGETNAANEKLYEAAKAAGILVSADAFIGRADA